MTQTTRFRFSASAIERLVFPADAAASSESQGFENGGAFPEDAVTGLDGDDCSFCE